MDDAELARRLGARLSRPELGDLWFTLLRTPLGSSHPNADLSDIAIDLVHRAGQRGLQGNLLAELRTYYPHVLVGTPLGPLRGRYNWQRVPPNQHFVGRETELAALHATLQRGEAATVAQAIAGLGGIGKTTLAVRYAQTHADDYTALLWSGAESDAALNDGLAAIARGCGFATEEAKADAIQAFVFAKLRETRNWLFLLDNVEPAWEANGDPVLDSYRQPVFPELLRTLLTVAGGRFLLTTRLTDLAALGLAAPLSLDVLPPEKATAFLRERVGRGTGEEATALAEALGRLPLALEQAAAFLKVYPLTSFPQYLDAFQREPVPQLERAGPVLGQYGSTVAKTWQISVRAAQTESDLAPDLLNACAFFAPDAIPIEVLKELFPDADAVSRAAGALVRYSLLTVQNDGSAVSLHRLVQEVTRAGLTDDAQRTWAERVVAALNTAFPYVEFGKTWALCDRLVPHAQAADAWIDRFYLNDVASGRLLNKAAYYLQERARHQEAEPLYRRALQIRQSALGPEHPDTATSLNNLAALLRDTGRFQEAEPLYRRAVRIFFRLLGPEHPNAQTALTNYLLAKVIDSGAASTPEDAMAWLNAHPEQKEVMIAEALGETADS